MSRPELLLLALSVACVDPASSPDAGPADAGVGFPQRYDLSGPFGGAMCRSSMLATSTGVAIIWEQFPTGAANEQVVFSRVASDGSIEVQPTRIYDGNIRDLWLMPDGDDFVVVVDSFVAGFEAIGVDGAGQVAATNSLGGIGSDANFVKTDGQYWAIYRRSISAADDKIAYRTFDAPGTNLSAATDLAPAIAGVQRDPHVDVDGDGVWSAFVSGSVVHLQKTDSTGTPLIADQEALPELNSPYVDVTASSEGVLLMAAHYPGSSPERVAYRTFDATGQPTSGTLAMPNNRSESETYELTASAGAAYVAAEDDSDSALPRIALRRVELADGALTESMLTPPTIEALCPSLAVVGERLAVSFRARAPETVRQLVFVDL